MSSKHDGKWLVSNRFLPPGDLLTDQASWNLHDPCVQRGENISRSRSATHRKGLYRLTGVDEKHEMRWTEYAIAMLLFSGVSMALLYLIERTQKWLPFNPQKFP